MRVKQMVNKKECLECLFTEINILTECRHPNVVKILDASFDGTQIKEQHAAFIGQSTKAKSPEQKKTGSRENSSRSNEDGEYSSNEQIKSSKPTNF